MSNSPIASRRTLLGGVFGATALGGALVAAGGQSAAAVGVPSAPRSNFFLELPPIRGESVAQRHRDQIDVLDWSVGVDNAVATGGGSGGRRSGKPVPRPFTVVARSSIASPLLFAAAAQGTRFPQAKLSAEVIGEQSFEYLLITLGNVVITSYGMAPDDVDATPTDVFELAYGSLLMSWTPQGRDGRPGTAVVSGYDFERGRAL